MGAYLTYWIFLKTQSHIIIHWANCLLPDIEWPLILQDYKIAVSAMLTAAYLVVQLVKRIHQNQMQTLVLFLGREDVSLFACVITPATSLVAQTVKCRPTMWETRVQSLGQEDFLEKEMANPLQYSCLENPRDRGAWWAAVYGVAQSWTWLKWLSSGKHCSSSVISDRVWFFFNIWRYCVFVLVAQSCPTLCDPMDCSPPGFSIHGIFQARIVE